MCMRPWSWSRQGTPLSSRVRPSAEQKTSIFVWRVFFSFLLSWVLEARSWSRHISNASSYFQVGTQNGFYHPYPSRFLVVSFGVYIMRRTTSLPPCGPVKNDADKGHVPREATHPRHQPQAGGEQGNRRHTRARYLRTSPRCSSVHFERAFTKVIQSS